MVNQEFFHKAEQKCFLVLTVTNARKNDSNMYLPEEDENRFDLPASEIPRGS
jgi:hypothetical protein